MTIAANLMDQLNDAGVLFNVRTERLSSASGLSIPNKKVIINDSTNEPISVVGDGYKVVTNEQIFDGFTKAIDASGVNTDGATINVLKTPTGSRSMVNFLFPSESIKVSGDSSTTALQISALNSYDGSTRYITKAGGLRMKCHSKNLDVDAGARQVMNMVQEFQNASEYWGRLLSRNVSADEARQVFFKFLGLEGTPLPEAVQNKRYLELCAIAKGYVNEMGSNAYALYNTLTDYISHTPARSADTALTNAVSRQRKMADVMKSSNVFC